MPWFSCIAANRRPRCPLSATTCGAPARAQIDFLRANVLQLAAQPRLAPDTVVMNPPFGTKIKGADLAFLRAACALGPATVYSLHKSSTRQHIEKVALR